MTLVVSDVYLLPLLNPRPYRSPCVQVGATPTIYNFRQLRELEFVVIWPNSVHTKFLTSITSTELQKITFPAKHIANWMLFAQRVEAWDGIDAELCRLVDRLRATGYRHTLEVELRLTKIGEDPGECDCTRFLPRFREKGVVTIVGGDHGNLVLHSSTKNR